MRAIRSKNTVPELVVRRLAHRLGYRFRLHYPHLPGKPDLVFATRRKIIFVHGCFWHGHESPNCSSGLKPKSNRGYWLPKLARNSERDAEHEAALAADGWDVLVIWECETKDDKVLAARLRQFLGHR